MPKIKNITPISVIEKDMKVQTAELYNNTPSSTPPVPLDEVKSNSQETTEPKKLGRKKVQTVIPRKNGKLIYFEERHNDAVEEIHWQCKADRQDVVRTALDEFIKRYMCDGRISPEGAELIRQYVEATRG